MIAIMKARKHRAGRHPWTFVIDANEFSLENASPLPMRTRTSGAFERVLTTFYERTDNDLLAPF